MNLISDKKKLMKDMLKDEKKSESEKSIDDLNKINQEIDETKKEMHRLEEDEKKLNFSGTCFVTFETP